MDSKSKRSVKEERIFHEAHGKKYARIRLHLPITSLPNMGKDQDVSVWTLKEAQAL